MGILDPKFKYVPAASTNVGKTIKRELNRLKAIAKAEKAEAERNAQEAAAKVAPMRKGTVK